MDSPNFEKVKEIIVEQLDVQADQVTEEASFIEDLGADSLDSDVHLLLLVHENKKVKNRNYSHPRPQLSPYPINT